jgi:aldose 1-epimerase
MIRRKRFFLGTALAVSLGMAIGTQAKPRTGPQIRKEVFGKTADSKIVDAYTLTNDLGAQVRILTYGGTIQSIKVPGGKGSKMGDVVLGCNSVKDYEKNNAYLGAIIGRYGNRIAKGAFRLNGKDYVLAKNNNGLHHLHGGVRGFDKVLWKAKPSSDKESASLELNYLSKDGEEGYPGNLTATVLYTWTNDNRLKIHYSASSDQDTIVNLTNHSYFNLGSSNTILYHRLLIHAAYFTPVDKGLIPTGKLKPVKGSPFDFNLSTLIGKRINQDNEQLKFGLGYDHNWVLDRKGPGLELVAKLEDFESERGLEVYTTEPGLQFYSGNFLDDSIIGKEGKTYNYRMGLCLETQHFPDSPNRPKFPSTMLKAGQPYSSTTVYKFFVEEDD